MHEVARTGAIATPWWGAYDGLNDRWAVGGARVMAAYGMRRALHAAYAAAHVLFSENSVMYAVRASGAPRIGALQRVLRARRGGSPWQLVTPDCALVLDYVHDPEHRGLPLDTRVWCRTCCRPIKAGTARDSVDVPLHHVCGLPDALISQRELYHAQHGRPRPCIGVVRSGIEYTYPHQDLSYHQKVVGSYNGKIPVERWVKGKSCGGRRCR